MPIGGLEWTESALDVGVSEEYGKFKGRARGYCGMTGRRFSCGTVGGGDDIELVMVGDDGGELK